MPESRFKGKPPGGRRDWRPRAARAERKAGGSPPEDGSALLYGWHTVVTALGNPARRFRRLLLTENTLRRLTEEGVTLPIAPEVVRPDVIASRLSADAVHQGLLAETDPLESVELDAIESDGLVLVLDQITDPHNVGAILRSAAAFDVQAVVTPARYSPEATGVLAKAASGALDLIPVVTVGSLARAIGNLRERGFYAIGLDSAGDSELASAQIPYPLALVLGAEGKGLRPSTRAVCDRVARLDMPGRIKALNVSNAAALSLYIATRNRP